MKIRSREPGSTAKIHNESGPPSVRLDIWLWASRFHKTRKLASDAIKGGHVAVNGKRAKPSKQIRVGDMLRIRRFPLEYTVEATGLSEKRLSASLAAALYRETPESEAARNEKSQLLRDQRAGLRYDRRRPGKRDRDKMLKVKNQLPDWPE